MVKPEKMSAWRLYSYSQHLRENRQKALRYEIALWTKLIYPLAVLVMMVLALPFAHFQSAAGGRRREDLRRHHARPRVPLPEPAVLAPRAAERLARRSRSAIMPTLIFLTLAVGMMWWQERR